MMNLLFTGDCSRRCMGCIALQADARADDGATVIVLTCFEGVSALRRAPWIEAIRLLVGVPAPPAIEVDSECGWIPGMFGLVGPSVHSASSDDVGMRCGSVPELLMDDRSVCAWRGASQCSGGDRAVSGRRLRRTGCETVRGTTRLRGATA